MLSARFLCSLLSAASFSSLSTAAELCADSEEGRRQIVSRLGAIRDGYIECEKGLDNIRVVGKYRKGDYLVEDRPFVLAVRGNCFRYEEQILLRDNTRHLNVRLDDGKHFFVFNKGGLGIAIPKDREAARRRATWMFYDYQMPHGGNGRQSVADFCDWLIDVILGRGEYEGRSLFSSDDRRLCMRDENGLITIELVDGIPPPEGGGMRISVVVDQNRGYKMVKFSRVEGTGPEEIENSWYHAVEVTSEYREIAPGVFYLSSGSRHVKESGKVAERQGSAANATVDVEITSVELGNFDVPDGYFSIHSLPIELGFRIHDQRVMPSEDYIYDKPPFDENVLQRQFDLPDLE